MNYSEIDSIHKHFYFSPKSLPTNMFENVSPFQVNSWICLGLCQDIKVLIVLDRIW